MFEKTAPFVDRELGVAFKIFDVDQLGVLVLEAGAKQYLQPFFRIVLDEVLPLPDVLLDFIAREVLFTLCFVRENLGLFQVLERVNCLAVKALEEFLYFDHWFVLPVSDSASQERRHAEALIGSFLESMLVHARK